MAFQLFPWLGRTEVEQVRMAALHLGHEIVRHLVGGELPHLLGQHQLPGELEEKLPHASRNMAESPAAEGLDRAFEHFLDQVGPQRLPVCGRSHGSRERRSLTISMAPSKR